MDLSVGPAVLDETKNFLHRRGLSDHLRRSGRSTEHGLEVHVFLAKLSVLVGLFDQRFQIRQREGLRQIVVGAESHGLNRALDRAFTGQQDDFALRISRFEPLQHLDARQARHIHVQHDDVELAAIGHVESLIAAGGVPHLEAAPREALDERIAEFVVIVNEQQIELFGIVSHGLQAARLRIQGLPEAPDL